MIKIALRSRDAVASWDLRAFIMPRSLQGKIIIVVFGKIQSFSFGGDPFERVIFESSAAFIDHSHPVLAAQDLSYFQSGAIHTVRAGTFYFFTKQHMDPSVFTCLDYTRIAIGFPQLFLCFMCHAIMAATRTKGTVQIRNTSDPHMIRLRTHCAAFPSR